MKNWWRFIPLIVAFGLGMLLYKGFELDPKNIPSALIGQTFPEFQLVSLKDESTLLSREDLFGEVALVNVWATWCVVCKIEHPFLNTLANEYGITIHGVNMQDEWDEAQKWVDTYGDPFTQHVFDPEGRLGFDLGVTGAPETFLIDQNGTVVYRHQGEVNPRVWNNVLAPRVAELKGIPVSDLVDDAVVKND